MPFKSEKQRRWMWANRADIARRWTKKYGPHVETLKKLRKLSGGKKRR